MHSRLLTLASGSELRGVQPARPATRVQCVSLAVRTDDGGRCACRGSLPTSSLRIILNVSSFVRPSTFAFVQSASVKTPSPSTSRTLKSVAA